MSDRPLPFLFDLDGTLADTLADIAASTNHVRTRWRLPALPIAAVRSHIGHGARALLRGALAELGAPDSAAVWDEAYACYAEHHARQCTATAALYPGVRDHLTALRRRGHPLAIVTNKPTRFAEAIVQHLGLAEWLPVVVGGDALPQRKPDPAPVHEALRRLGCRAVEGGTMVGDSEADLRAGRAAGLTTIACTFGYTDPAALRAIGADVYWRAFGVPDA